MRKKIEAVKKSNGFNGNETSRELMYYLIGEMKDMKKDMKSFYAIRQQVRTNTWFVRIMAVAILGISLRVIFI